MKTQPQPEEDFLKQSGLVFDQIRAKAANLREGEEAGLVEKGAADAFLEKVRVIVESQNKLLA